MPIYRPTARVQLRHLASTALFLTSSLSATALSAQAAGAPPDSQRREVNTCYRFAFGQWSPALDQRAAGHDSTARTMPSAAPGRDWAANTGAGERAELMLYPAWWPAGVRIELPSGAPAIHDTVRGRATALVADANSRPPVSTARAWGVACGDTR